MKHDISIEKLKPSDKKSYLVIDDVWIAISKEKALQIKNILMELDKPNRYRGDLEQDLASLNEINQKYGLYNNKWYLEHRKRNKGE